MKKITSLFLLAALSVTIVGCSCQQQGEVNTVDQGTAKTGNVIDLTEMAGQTVTTTPGDVLYVKLVNPNEENDQRQWYFNGSEAMDYLTLDKHQADDWWLLVEKTGNFAIIYTYGLPGEAAEKTFKVDILSQL